MPEQHHLAWSGVGQGSSLQEARAAHCPRDAGSARSPRAVGLPPPPNPLDEAGPRPAGGARRCPPLQPVLLTPPTMVRPQATPRICSSSGISPRTRRETLGGGGLHELVHVEDSAAGRCWTIATCNRCGAQQRAATCFPCGAQVAARSRTRIGRLRKQGIWFAQGFAYFVVRMRLVFEDTIVRGQDERCLFGELPGGLGPGAGWG